MERSPGGQSVARREFLSVSTAQQNVRRRSVTPIILEQRWISMETPTTTTASSSSSVDPNCTTVVTVSTATTTSTATATPATSTTTTTAKPKPTGAGSGVGPHVVTTTTRTPTNSGSSLPQTSRGKDHAPLAPVGTSTHVGSLSLTVPTSTPHHTTSTRQHQSAVQTSGLSPAGVNTSAATSSGPQTLGLPTPQHGRRQRGSPTPPRARSSAVEAATQALQQTLALVGGQKRPLGAEVPATSLSTKPASGEGGDGGTRLPAAPKAGQDVHTPTVNQALLEESQSARSGQKPETNKLSTEQNQESSRQPTKIPTESDKGKQPASDRGRELSRRAGGASSSSRLGVQFSDETPSTPPRPSPRAVGDVMQFFAEQEKSLQDSFLSLPKKSAKKQRSPSPKVSPAPGLEHLDNLVRLMEQLGSLKDENSRLRQRCHYLESTKLLLQARKDLSVYEAGGTPSRFKTMPVKQQKQRHLYHRHHHHHHHAKGDGGLDSRETSLLDVSGKEEAGDASSATRRSRISSAEELDYLDFVDSASDQRPKRSKSGLPKRSFSTGSLEVPSELLLGDVSEGETRKRIKSKTGRSIFSSKSGAKSKSSKSGSKWARVKKVLTGQKIYEDLGTTIRTIRDLGKSSGGHSRHSTSGASISPADMSPPSSQISSGDHRHTDSGVGLTSAPAQQDTQGSSPSGGVSSRNPLVVVPLVSRVDAEATSRSEQEGSDSELTCEIWMGPPDWWEEYEARTEGSGRRGRGEEDEEGVEGAGCGASTTNSEVSSVIEVTTMYLGSSKKDAPGASSSSQPSPAATTSSGGLTVSMTASSISSSSATTRTGAVSPAMPGEQQFLTVEKYPLQRRQSSPSLNGKEGSEEGEDFLDDLESLSESPTRVLHKSSSCQSADLDLPRSSEFPGDSRQHGGQKSKSYRTAWGRVKDIIHTRKDSVKKRPKKQRSGGTESEETSEVDMDGLYMEEHAWRSSSFGESLLGRSTPKTSSPVVLRQQTGQQPKTVSSSSGADMAALLAGRMSDDFNKKMLEWEAKKNRKSAPLKVSGEDSDLGSLDVSTASQDFPVRTVDLRDFKGKVPESSSESSTIAGESHTSLEVLGAHTSSPAHLEEIQKRMTDSFSRKMQEWEKLKYRSSQSSQREPSPDMERKGSKGRKDDRQKSKRSREDKEKEKLEKLREREMQKVEREQLKLEKEKIRLEKERLRALEREAKLEKIKGRLSQTEQESSFKNPVLGPLAEYKVTADFAHKLHQWELKKGLSHDVSNSIYLEAQKLNVQHLREETERQKPVKFSLTTDEAAGDVVEEISEGQGYWDPSGARAARLNKDPELTGGGIGDDDDDDDLDVDKETEGDGDDETTTSVTEECLIKSNIDTERDMLKTPGSKAAWSDPEGVGYEDFAIVKLERANRQLIENLQHKEMEYATVQQQVTEVNRKLAKVKEEHAREMARFHRELALGSIAEPVKLEVGELESTMSTMEEKIKAMENLGERLALSMESAAVGKWQSIDGEETVHTQLVELVDQMRNMLVQASHSAEESKKSMALSNFEKLYSQAMKLQVQMNNLRLSHLERNREIMTVKRQLLLQEVNNLLLQADITRRETELYQYQAAKKFASLRRWNTFSGSDRHRPAQAQMEITAKPRVELQPDGRSRQIDAPHVNIPYIPEDVILASAASSSISAPASPSAVEAAGGTPLSTSSGESPLPRYQQQQSVPTTSSAAGDLSPVHHVTPSSSLARGAQQQHYQLPTEQQQQQQKKSYLEGQHHSSTAATLDSISPSENRRLITSSATVSSESHPQHLLPVSPASPPYQRAISDPVQAKGEIQTQYTEEVAPSSKSSQPLSSSMHPSTTVLRSASEGEGISPRQHLSLPPSSQPMDHSQSSSLKRREASGAVPCAEAAKDGDQDQSSTIHQAQEQYPSEAQTTMSPSLSTETKKNDSVPLYYEIMELRKAKSIVERGSPTLILSKEGKGSSSVPSPGKTLSRGDSSSSSTRSGTPSQTIPRQRSLDLAPSTPQGPRLTRAATSIDDDYSQEPTVMKCTKTTTPVTQSEQQQPDVRLDSSSVVSRLSPRPDGRRDLPPNSDSGRTITSKCPRSPVTKHNYLRRQKEERDSAASSGKHLDYKAISPKGSPLPTRGKPPLPRQNTPVRQSPQTSPAVPEKGPRSKSVGEMTQGSGGATVSTGESSSSKPLQEAINKFEKRQTMIETEDRPIELRKTPSPTLHLPRVGLVSRVRRLKPAAELLEESQKFKSGHSIYATRIMHRYLPKDGTKSLPPEPSLSQPTVSATSNDSGSNNKENNFVHTMVRRLSRETSPIKSAGSSRTNSELSLKRTDSPRSNSEFVSHIVRKLSTGSGSSSPKSRANPFKDRTNDGQVKRMAQSFDDQPDSCSPERTLSDSELGRLEQQTSPIAQRRVQPIEQSAAKAQHRKSCEVAMTWSSSSAVTSESSPFPSGSNQTQKQQQQGQHAASSSPTTPQNHQSLPALALSSGDATARHRAATYCHSEQERRQIERQAQPARPASTSSAYDPHGHQLVSTDATSSTTGGRTKGERTGRSAASSLSPVRRGTGRGKMGTVRVLCKQSISFDLGVSLYTQKSEAAGGSPKCTRQVRSWDPSESARAEAAAASSEIDVEVTSHSSPGPSRAAAFTEGRPVSSGSEGDAAHSASHAEEKTKFRRFLDSSIKFFKVSK